jgi:hypothetical protein
MAWFRLVYSAIFGIALVNLIIVLILLSGVNYLAVFNSDQLYAQGMIFLKAFYEIWAIGIIIFGFHLILLGFLAFKSGYIPKIVGILLIFAGFSYLIDNISNLIFPDFNLAISVVMGWGELIFMFWLLLKGGKRPKDEVVVV